MNVYDRSSDINVPAGFANVYKEFVQNLAQDKPNDVYSYAAEYFEEMLEERGEHVFSDRSKSKSSSPSKSKCSNQKDEPGEHIDVKPSMKPENVAFYVNLLKRAKSEDYPDKKQEQIISHPKSDIAVVHPIMEQLDTFTDNITEALRRIIYKKAVSTISEACQAQSNSENYESKQSTTSRSTKYESESDCKIYEPRRRRKHYLRRSSSSSSNSSSISISNINSSELVLPIRYDWSAHSLRDTFDISSKKSPNDLRPSTCSSGLRFMADKLSREGLNQRLDSDILHQEEILICKQCRKPSYYTLSEIMTSIGSQESFYFIPELYYLEPSVEVIGDHKLDWGNWLRNYLTVRMIRKWETEERPSKPDHAKPSASYIPNNWSEFEEQRMPDTSNAVRIWFFSKMISRWNSL